MVTLNECNELLYVFRIRIGRKLLRSGITHYPTSGRKYFFQSFDYSSHLKRFLLVFIGCNIWNWSFKNIFTEFSEPARQILLWWAQFFPRLVKSNFCETKQYRYSKTTYFHTFRTGFLKFLFLRLLSLQLELNVSIAMGRVSKQ